MKMGSKEFPLMTLDELEADLYTLIPNLEEASQNPAVENPFRSEMKLSFWGKVKVGFLLVLVPLRAFLFLIAAVATYLAGVVFMLGYKRTDPETPMTSWRRFGQHLVWFLARSAAFALGFYHIPVRGKMAKQSEAPICIIAPHSSFMDALIISVVGHRTTFVSRKENGDVPLLGRAFQLLQPVAVSREAKDSRLVVVKEIKRRAATGEWPAVAIFPEGTVTNGRCLITFKPGAFYPGLPIQPLLLRYRNSTNCTVWTWDSPPTWKLVVVLCAQLINYVEYQVLPVYHPSEEEKEDAFLYAHNVRDYMARYAKLPVTDHSFEDTRLMLEASKLGLPMEAGLVEYCKLSPMIGMNCETMIEYFRKFAAIDTSKDGVVDMGEFSDYLNLPASEEVQRIFNIYDIAKSGTINFRQYLLGFWLISRPFNTEAMISSAFDLFDADSSGWLSYEAVSTSIRKLFADISCDQLKRIFGEMDRSGSGEVDKDEFRAFCLSKPEYALLFMHFTKRQQQSSLHAVETSDKPPFRVKFDSGKSAKRRLVEPTQA